MALEKLFGKAPLKRSNGSEVTLASLNDTDSYVGVYFSAHWCGPCRQFTPELAKFYNRMREAGKKLEIIFVSADRSEADYREYFETMPWTALPFNSALAPGLNKKFKVQGIPHFAIINGATGKIVCADGRAQVLSDPAGKAFPWPKPTFKQAFDKTFVSASGKDVTFAELSKLDAVGIYFSAHWCGPCKRFTPQLIKTYNAVKEAGKSFELIFVSSDRSAEEFSGYFSTMPWLSYPFVDKEGRAAAGRFLPHQGIPSLFIVDPKTGKVINSSGRMAISKDPKGADFPWVPKPAPALGEGADINSAPVMSLLLDDIDDFDAADECLAAFQTFAKKTQASWDVAKDDEEDDYPLEFGYGDDDVELVAQIRSVLGLGRVPSPTLLIIDVPAGVKYMWTGDAGTYPTAKDFAAMVDGYVKGSLTPVGLKG